MRILQCCLLLSGFLPLILVCESWECEELQPNWESSSSWEKLLYWMSVYTKKFQSAKCPWITEITAAMFRNLVQEKKIKSAGKTSTHIYLLCYLKFNISQRSLFCVKGVLISFHFRKKNTICISSPNRVKMLATTLLLICQHQVKALTNKECSATTSEVNRRKDFRSFWKCCCGASFLWSP